MKISCCRLKSASLPLLSCCTALPCAGDSFQGPTLVGGPQQWDGLLLYQGDWNGGESFSPQQPLFAHNPSTFPISQPLPPIFTSFDSSWLLAVSSCSYCPQTWSVTGTKSSSANISGKPLIISGNRSDTVNFRLAREPLQLALALLILLACCNSTQDLAEDMAWS